MKRPTGISVLAALYGVGSVFLLAMQIAMARRMADGFAQTGASATTAHLIIAFLGALGVAAAFGMWTGKRWGWWLDAFYLVYSVARNLNALQSIPMLVEQSDIPERRAAEYHVKFGGRVFFHSLICW